MRSSPCLRILLITTMLGATLCPSGTAPESSGRALGAEARPAGPPPLAVASVASVERLLDDVDYVFETAERPDIAQLVRSVLSALGDLKGLDRERPLGAMLVLQPGLAPRPVLVGFVPVRNVDEFRQTFSLGIEIREVAGSEDRYEIIAPQRTLYARLSGEYAFIAAEKELLDRRFPDPVELTREKMARYDAAASLRLADVPPGMKTLIIDYLRAQAAADLQRRDGESEARFALRKVSTENTLESLERGLTQGTELTLGWRLSREQRSAELELAFAAQPESSLAGDLRQTGGRASRFAGAAIEAAPLSLAVSWVLDDGTREVAVRALEAAREEASGRYPTQEIEAAATAFYDSLQKTAEAGHVDLLVQLAGEPPGPLVLTGGVKINGTEALAEALPAAVEQLGSAPNVDAVEVAAERHQGVALHRIVGSAVQGANQRLFGEHPVALVGAGADALWLAVGEDTAGPALGEAIEQSATGGRADEGVPLRLRLHAAPWIATLGAELGPSPEERELLRKAFAHGRDAVGVEVLASEDVLRLRLELEEGFVRLFGLAVARQRDQR